MGARGGEPAVRRLRYHRADGPPAYRGRHGKLGGARKDGRAQAHPRQTVQAVLNSNTLYRSVLPSATVLAAAARLIIIVDHGDTTSRPDRLRSCLGFLWRGIITDC